VGCDGAVGMARWGFPLLDFCGRVAPVAAMVVGLSQQRPWDSRGGSGNRQNHIKGAAVRRALHVSMAIVLIILGGCASTGPPPVFQGYLAHEDPFRPGRVHQYSDNIKLGGTWRSHFDINHVITSEGSQYWYLSTTYGARDWIFVKTLAFVVDGTVWSFETQANPKREVIPVEGGYSSYGRGRSGGYSSILEKNKFIVNDGFMDSICLATTVIVRLTGDHYKVERTLTPEDIHHFKWFIEFVRNDGFGAISKAADEGVK
jgi:hypothetical protein